MKVALVHDYLNEFGGAERVLKALTELYPRAPIYTIFYKKNSEAGREFKDSKIVQSWFSYLPFAHKLISPLRFLIPLIWSSFEFSDYELVITSSSWAVTRGMRRGTNTTEICYLHTPPRYLYGYDTSRNWQNKWFSGIVKIYAIVVNHFMRIYDFNQAQKVDYYIVNSKNVGRRLEKFYRKYDYKVIYPPIEVDIKNVSSIDPEAGSYFLTGGRLVAAKNFDKIIEAFNKNGKKLKIFGTGISEKELKKLARENIEFVGRVPDKRLVSLYKGAKAFIVAQKDEDAGITLVESMLFGTPVIAYQGGGYIETVIEGKTGVFFDELSPNSINETIKEFEQKKFNPKDCITQAKKFSKERFKKQIQTFIKNNVK